MSTLKVAGVLMMISGILLPLIGFEIPSPINTLLKIDESATSTSYLFFPFINWLTIIGAAVFAVGYYKTWRTGK